VKIDAKRIRALRERVCRANLDLVAKGLVPDWQRVGHRPRSGWWPPPSGVAYDELSLRPCAG
jgi:hypothetical protein